MPRGKKKDTQEWTGDALAKLPKATAERISLFTQMERLKSDQQEAAGECSAHMKRLTDRFGLTKAAIKIRAILAKLKDGEYARTMSQVQLLLDDINRPLQMDLFAEDGGAPDAGEPELHPGTGDEPEQESMDVDLGDGPKPVTKRRGRPPKAKGEPIQNANKHLKKVESGIDLETAKSEFENARIASEKKRTPAQAMKEGAAASDEFLAKQVAKRKAPPPPPANDTFLDEADPNRQGDYSVQ